MSTNATLDQIKSYRASVTQALLDQHRRKGYTVQPQPRPMFTDTRAVAAPVKVEATEAQRRYLADLLGRLAAHAPKVHADATRWIVGLGTLDRTDASRAIDAVKRHLDTPAEIAPVAPAPTTAARVYAEVRAALEAVPSDCRYALDFGEGDWRFYRVLGTDRNKLVQVGHADGFGLTWTRLSADAQLAAARSIAADPREAMLNFGRHLGVCGHCGRALTNQASREAGIGPICASK